MCKNLNITLKIYRLNCKKYNRMQFNILNCILLYYLYIIPKNKITKKFALVIFFENLPKYAEVTD